MPLARPVTREESAFYLAHGWVVLRQWIDPAVTGEMLAVARAVMGEMAARTPRSPLQDDPRVWRRWDEPWRTHASFERFARSSEFAAPLVALSRLRSGLRYIDDQIVVKLPASAGAMGETPWHQDHPCLPIDRAGDLTAWVALHEMEPEHGTLRFLDRSHHEGPLDAVSLQLDLRESHPSLFERYPASDPLHLRAGDATVHHGCTVHGAAANDTASPRWAYIAEFIPGDARVAGRRSARVEAAGLAAGDGFDHPAFRLTSPLSGPTSILADPARLAGSVRLGRGRRPGSRPRPAGRGHGASRTPCP